MREVLYISDSRIGLVAIREAWAMRGWSVRHVPLERVVEEAELLTPAGLALVSLTLGDPASVVEAFEQAMSSAPLVLLGADDLTPDFAWRGVRVGLAPSGLSPSRLAEAVVEWLRQPPQVRHLTLSRILGAVEEHRLSLSLVLTQRSQVLGVLELVDGALVRAVSQTQRGLDVVASLGKVRSCSFVVEALGEARAALVGAARLDWRSVLPPESDADPMIGDEAIAQGRGVLGLNMASHRLTGGGVALRERRIPTGQYTIDWSGDEVRAERVSSSLHLGDGTDERTLRLRAQEHTGEFDVSPSHFTVGGGGLPVGNMRVTQPVPVVVLEEVPASEVVVLEEVPASESAVPEVVAAPEVVAIPEVVPAPKEEKASGPSVDLGSVLDNDFAELYRMAMTAYRQREFEEAIRLLEACERLRPRDKRIISNLNTIRARRGGG